MEKDAPMCNLGQYSFDANFIAIALVRRSYYRKLRVQSEEFSEEKDSFYMILKRKYMYSFRWDSNAPIHGLRSELSTTVPSDLLMNGHKSSVYQVSNCLFTNQSSMRNCHKMTNCEQFRTKCSAKIAVTWALGLASTDVFLIKMWQESYNRRDPESSKNKKKLSENELNFSDVR